MYDSAAIMIQVAAHDFPDRYRSAVNVHFEVLTVGNKYLDYYAAVFFLASRIREVLSSWATYVVELVAVDTYLA